MLRAVCKVGNHYPETLLCCPLGYEGGFQLNNDGSARCWFDGTRGITAEQELDIQSEESAVCYDSDCVGYLEEIDWEHTEESE